MNILSLSALFLSIVAVSPGVVPLPSVASGPMLLGMTMPKRMLPSSITARMGFRMTPDRCKHPMWPGWIGCR